MNANPLKQGILIENSAGIGTITRSMVQDRARELAVINDYQEDMNEGPHRVASTSPLPGDLLQDAAIPGWAGRRFIFPEGLWRLAAAFGPVPEVFAGRERFVFSRRGFHERLWLMRMRARKTPWMTSSRAGIRSGYFGFSAWRNGLPLWTR